MAATSNPTTTGLPDIDIQPAHWATVQRILAKHVPGYEVRAFGSRARKQARRYSDLDVVIITHKPLPLSTLANLADDFSESDLPWKVDVLDWAATSESFRQSISQTRMVVLQPADVRPVQTGITT